MYMFVILLFSFSGVGLSGERGAVTTENNRGGTAESTLWSEEATPTTVREY